MFKSEGSGESVRVEISKDLARDLERLARMLNMARRELMELRLRQAIAREIVDLEQQAAAKKEFLKKWY